MNFEEFLTPEQLSEVPVAENASAAENEVPVAAHPIELDVQKAVVESLAADKAAQKETITLLRKDNYRLQSEIAVLKAKLVEQSEALGKVGEVLAKNEERPASSQVALIDRDVELDEKFPGEVRDHLLEVVKDARAAAEAAGRVRRAQILESILLANEPSGKLMERRESLQQLFAANGNIVSGPVMEELTKRSIPFKHGEEYLLPSEIIARVY